MTSAPSGAGTSGRLHHRTHQALVRLLTALVLAAGALLIPFAPAGTAATETLLSQGRPVTASSTENSVAFPAGAAVDGNAGTRWSSAFADPQWIQVDLGATATVSRVVLQWEAAYATGFRIQTSADGAIWTDVYTTTTGSGGTQNLTVNGTGRYVRMYGTARATQYGYSLWEFQVYGTSGTSTGDVELSYQRPAVASSSQDDGNCGGCVPAKVDDQDPATRWATSSTTGWTDPGWIYLDLGATAQIHRVVLQWDPAYASAYRLQVSNDAATWTDIYSTTTGKGFKETLTGLNGSGRYLRMYGTARGTAYGYSLWEFQVYGTGGAPTPPPALPPNPSFPGHLVWSDEFNGANGTAPDASKWTTDPGPGVNNELEYYTSGNKNLYQDGTGNLVIDARKEVTAGSSCPRDPLSGSTTCQYTSGRINTSDHFDFTYGHAEARIKVTGTQGLWPAFWMLGANFKTGTPWPASGEIDVMEHVGKVADSVYSTLHAPAYNGAGGYGSPYTVAGSDFASAFHTYGVDWDSAHMTFYVDGNAFFTVDRDVLETTRGPWVYDHPFYLILNNAVGGDWPGAPDATSVFPQRMLVDYVRVYQ
jgi:beta-glucanase (GH16 family)